MYNANEYEKTYITTNASNVIFTGRGTLGGICVNTTAAGIITVQDNGTTFAILKTSIVENEYLKDIIISNGLTIVTANSPDITVKWVKA